MIKGRQTYSFVVGIFTQGEAFGALISQYSTYNSYVSHDECYWLYINW